MNLKPTIVHQYEASESQLFKEDRLIDGLALTVTRFFFWNKIILLF